MIKAIVFDLYGTLIDIQTDETKQQFWRNMTAYYENKGVHIKDLRKSYKKAVEVLKKESNAQYPDIEILEVFKALYNQNDVVVDSEDLKETAQYFRKASRNHIALYPGAIELLDYLRAFGYRVILLSNAQAAFTNDELALMGLHTKFDAIYLSSDYKVCKPDQKYFQLMLDEEVLQASECIYVGNDHIADVGGATAVGMESIYLHTNCSQATLSPFDCLLKVIPGDLYQVLEYFKKNEITNR